MIGLQQQKKSRVKKKKKAEKKFDFKILLKKIIVQISNTKNLNC